MSILTTKRLKYDFFGGAGFSRQLWSMNNEQLIARWCKPEFKIDSVFCLSFLTPTFQMDFRNFIKIHISLGTKNLTNGSLCLDIYEKGQPSSVLVSLNILRILPNYPQ